MYKMSQQPKPYEALNVFNPVNYPGDAGSDKLNFSVAQGTETFPNGIILGDGTYLNSATGGSGSVVTNPLVGNLNAGGYTVTNLATPSSSTDAVTLGYFQSNSLTNPLSADLDAGGNQIFDMADPTTAGGAVNLQYLTNQLSSFLTIASAASTYETIANAASTYLTIANAAATYETIANAASTYLTIANAASTYAPLASPALTGSPTAPTQATTDNSTKIATTAFVQSHVPTTIPFAPYSFSWTAENFQGGTPAPLTLYGPAIRWPFTNPNNTNAVTNDEDSYFVMRVTATNSWNGRAISTPSYTGYNNFGCASAIVYVFPMRWGSLSWCGYDNATSTCKYLQNGGGYSGTTGQEGASVSEKSRGLYTTTGLVSNEGEIQNNYSSMFNSFGPSGQRQWQFVSQSPFSAGNSSQYGIRAVLNVEILSMSQNCPPLTIIPGDLSIKPSGTFNGNDFLDVSE